MVTAAGRSAELIGALGLRPHPEGGYFTEIFRSPARVSPEDGRPGRPALTSIYFLLPAGAVSRWHRVLSDEAWHYQEGAPLELWIAPPGAGSVDRHRLGPPSEGQLPTRVVPGGSWQAARSTGEYTLVACTVGPGFEFQDFVLAADLPEPAASFRALGGGVAELL